MRYIINISKGKEFTKEQTQLLIDVQNNITDTTVLLLGE